MEIHQLETDGEIASYDLWLAQGPQNTLWQSAAWREYQKALGRSVRVYAAFEGEVLVAGAQVVIDTTTMGISTWDIPRGPVSPSVEVHHDAPLLDHIAGDAKRTGCMELFWSPAVGVGGDIGKPSGRHIQPEATVILDLSQPLDQIKAGMKQKCRYNIGLAERHGVDVCMSTDAGASHALMLKTGQRDKFGILPKKHYETFLQKIPGSFLLLAYASKESNVAIAGLIGVAYGNTGIYYYGASDDAYRALMAPYALQWAAIQHCKAQGALTYDFLGIAPPDAPEGHPWAGISRFKEQFGGTIVTYPPERSIVFKPVIKMLLGIKRKFF